MICTFLSWRGFCSCNIVVVLSMLTEYALSINYAIQYIVSSYVNSTENAVNIWRADHKVCCQCSMLSVLYLVCCPFNRVCCHLTDPKDMWNMYRNEIGMLVELCYVHSVNGNVCVAGMLVEVNCQVCNWGLQVVPFRLEA